MDSREGSRTVPNDHYDDYWTRKDKANGSSDHQPFDQTQSRRKAAQAQTASKGDVATTSRKPQDKQPPWSVKHGPTYAADGSKQELMTQRMRAGAPGGGTEHLCTGSKSPEDQAQLKRAVASAGNFRDSNGTRDGGFLRLVTGYWPKVPGRVWAFDDIQDPGSDRQR